MITEQDLIKAAEEWRNSKSFQSSISWDNTPYIEVSETDSARAIVKHGAWYFQAKCRNSLFITKERLLFAVQEIERHEIEFEQNSDY